MIPVWVNAELYKAVQQLREWRISLQQEGTIVVNQEEAYFQRYDEVGPRTILKYITCQITLNTNLGDIDHRKIKLLSLDSSYQDKSNELNFIKIQKIQSLVMK